MCFKLARAERAAHYRNGTGAASNRSRNTAAARCPRRPASCPAESRHAPCAGRGSTPLHFSSETKVYVLAQVWSGLPGQDVVVGDTISWEVEPNGVAVITLDPDC